MLTARHVEMSTAMSTPRDSDIEKVVTERFEELLVQVFARDASDVHPEHQAAAYEWMISATNVVAIATGEHGPHYTHASDLLRELRDTGFVEWSVIQNMRGVLGATKRDRESGLLRSFRYTEVAIAFDDFLDHAEDFRKAGKLQESAILVASVLEDTMRRIGEKHDVDERTLEPQINALVAKGVFGAIQAKRVKAWAGVRTSAFHARWEELDLSSIGEAIAGTRELVDRYLA